MNGKVLALVTFGLSMLALLGSGVSFVLGLNESAESRRQAEAAENAAMQAGGKAHRAQQDLEAQQQLLLVTQQELQELKRKSSQPQGDGAKNQGKDPKAPTEKNDPPKGKAEGCLQEFKGHDGAILCADFFPDGRRVVSGGADKTIRIWDIRKGEQLALLQGHTDAVVAVLVLWAADGRQLLSVSADGTLRLWDVETAKEVKKFGGHEGKITCAAVSRDGSQALTGGADKTVRLWDVAKGEEVKCFKGHTGTVLGVALSKDGKIAASCGSDRTVRVWDAGTGEEQARSEDHEGWVYSIALHQVADRTYIVSGGVNGIVYLHRLVPGQGGKQALTRFPPIKSNQGPIVRLSVSDSGSFFWMGEEGKLHKGSPDFVPTEGIAPGYPWGSQKEPMRSWALSRDGTRLLTGGDDKILRLWQAP
jgi:WD40 repeat protein